jgi:hypothetical protein
MPNVNWADANKLHCPHSPEHAVWISQDNRQYAVCRMADRHLFNTIRMLQRLEEQDYRDDYDEIAIDDWLEILDRELARRYANKVLEGKDELERINDSVPDRPLQT